MQQMNTSNNKEKIALTVIASLGVTSAEDGATDEGEEGLTLADVGWG